MMTCKWFIEINQSNEKFTLHTVLDEIFVLGIMESGFHTFTIAPSRMMTAAGAAFTNSKHCEPSDRNTRLDRSMRLALNSSP